MSTPDPNADRARLFAQQFNLEEERAFRVRWLRALRRRLFPELTEEDLDALDEKEEQASRNELVEPRMLRG